MSDWQWQCLSLVLWILVWTISGSLIDKHVADKKMAMMVFAAVMVVYHVISHGFGL